MGKRGFQPRGFSPGALAAAKQREADFLTVILPKVKLSASYRLRHQPARFLDDLHQECAGTAWKMFVSCIARNKDPLQQTGSIVKFSVTHIFNHRYLCGQESRTDAMSRCARERHGFDTVPLKS